MGKAGGEAVMKFVFILLAGLAGAVQEKKLPVPEASALKEPEKVVRDVFRDDFAKKSPADRLALARKLLQQGLETKGDAAAQFVLFREAREVATLAGDCEQAVRAIDEMGKRFDVDAAQMKSTAIAAISKNARTPEELCS